MQNNRGRPKIKPEIDEDKLGLNPLVEEAGTDFVIPVRKTIRDVTNKFGDLDLSEFQREATPFTKVFETAGFRARMVGLPIRAKEMMLHIIHSLESGQEYIWINRQLYMSENGIKSVNTYKSAIEALSLRRYVCPHIKIKDLLWINPKHFFKGDRISKYPKNIKIIETIKK